MKTLLIKNCNIFNPRSKMYFFGDIRIADGIITEIAGEEKGGPCETEIDAGGRLTVPGLIDPHAHVYGRNGCIGVEPDEYCIKRGVTLVVDAGTSGAGNFEDFKSAVIDKSDTTVKAFINLSSTGLQYAGREFEDISKLDYMGIPDLCRRYKSDIIGIKIRISESIAGENARRFLEYALETGEKTGLPVMVHPSNSLMSLEEILSLLRKGDIFTHCFHESNMGTGILDSRFRLKDCVLEALDRGIVFDVGHGAGSFSFKIAEAAVKQGFYPHTISTDLHAKNPKRPDLAYVLSKFMALGMTIEEVIESVTVKPLQALRLDKTAELAVGAAADLAILDIQNGSFDFEDSQGYKFAGNKLIRPWLTVYGMKVYRTT